MDLKEKIGRALPAGRALTYSEISERVNGSFTAIANAIEDMVVAGEIVRINVMRAGLVVPAFRRAWRKTDAQTGKETQS